jgi:nitrate reductase gamma subunit
VIGVIQIVTYLSVFVFVAAVVIRFIKISKLPLHLRWELYPVAHEKGKAHYGGSYLEEPDWWTKKRESSKAGELKVMIPEILLLKGVWEHNRKHWYKSFPFHFGLYLLGGLVALLLIGGIAQAAGMNVSPSGNVIGQLIHHVTYVVGYAGLGLGLLGALLLLYVRVFDPDYSEFTAKGDYFNLAFFVVVLAVALAAHLAGDRMFAGMRSYVQSLATFNLVFSGFWMDWKSALGLAEIVLASLLLAYIPLTHMSHFFTKWFMYHDIRWSDEPNLKGGKIEKEIGKALQYPVSWSAKHIRGDGKITWAEVATSDVEEKKS